MGIQDDRKLVDELCEIDHGLDAWEVDFVEGIARQVHDDKKPLTIKQRQMAEKILEEREDD